MIRSLLAIVAGFVAWTVVFLGGNQGLFAAFSDRYRPDQSTGDATVLLLTLVLSVVASILAGYVTGLVARERISMHAWVQGVVLLIVGIAVQAGYWNVLPLWYNLAFLVLLVPMTLLGGKLRQSRAGAGVAATA